MSSASGLFNRLEQATVDWRFANFNRKTKPSSEIVVIDIDEQSIKNLAPTYGRWPWPRRIYKDLIEFLAAGEPKAILFDILFSEEQKGTEDDQYFVEATHSYSQVSQAMQFLPVPSQEGESHVPLPPQVTERFSLRWAGAPPPTDGFPYRLNDFALPFPALLAGLNKLHVVTTDKDADGIFRRMPLLIPYDGKWYPSLTMQALMSRVSKPALAWGEGELLVFDGAQLKWAIPLTTNGLFRLNFYRAGREHEPTVYRMAEVIESARALQKAETDPSQWAVNPESLKGKTVLIGGSATGLEDLKATPVATSYPGVFLHATALSNILTDDHLADAPWSTTLFALLFLSLVSYLSIFYFDRTRLRLFVPVFSLGCYCALAISLFEYRQYALQMVLPLGGGGLAFIDGFIYMSFIEGRERRRMTGTLSKYLSPDLAKQMAEGGIDPTAEVGHKQELSVMFTDVRGFTTLSEKLPPENVVTILNEYLGEMTQIVFENRGTLDKFIGDAVMAFWGAPVKDPDHARRAVETGFAMRKRLAELNAAWTKQNRAPLAMGVGINTGDVIVGNIGSEKRLDYTVIGDNVNLASRLEGLTKYYGIDFIIGPATYAHVEKAYLCRPIDLVRVKGKAEAVAIYEPLVPLDQSGPEADRLRRLAEVFAKGWASYQRGEFQAAITYFMECLTLTGGQDGPSQVYIDRCRDLLLDPPQVWDGVYIAKSK